MTSPAASARPPRPKLPRRRRRIAAGVLGAMTVAITACSSGSLSVTTTTAARGSTSTTGSGPGLPAIHHVFVIMLENEGYPATFGNRSADPYLASTLPARGALLSNYYATGHLSNDNYISFLSGQAPNPSNQADCGTFANFPASATVTANGQISDSGCVFPASVPTVANQLTASGLTWKGYMEDMGNLATRETSTCGHPAVGSADLTQKAVPGDGYATRHDPFVYFHSIIDSAALCNSHVVPLGTTTGGLPGGTPSGTRGLQKDLQAVSSTPNFSFITPNLCNDGHDNPCVNQTGQSSQLANIDAFLQQWVPLITNSPAFKKDGLLEITFDEADIGDATACCGEVPGPAAPQPGISGPGGGRIGSVLISPFIHPGTVSSVPYNHYSSLATIEDLFSLARLGQAKTASATFGTDIFG
ncbi:MAG: alkaline phosphatase family protein [Acidimicrobiales bacterium]